MDVVIVIPARLDSQRLEQKLLRDLDGRTVLEHTASNVARCAEWADWVVATDSVEIHQRMLSAGHPVMMTTTDHSCGTERCAEAMHEYAVDFVINVQGDEPFVSADDLRGLYDLMRKNSVDIATLYTDLEETEIADESVVKVVVQEHMAKDFHREPKMTNETYKHIGVYAFRQEVLRDVVELPISRLEKERRLEQLRWQEAGYDIAARYTSHDYHSIDTLEDLLKAKSRLR